MSIPHCRETLDHGGIELEHLLHTLLAASPITLLLILMIGLRWGGERASALAWLCSMITALMFFGGDSIGLAIANSKGLALAIFISLIIWASAFLYNIVVAAGGMKVISRQFSAITDSQLYRALALAWVFSGFLQGVAGFGVPVAIVAPLVAAQGINPVLAVSATLIGHSWSVTFGSMGSSYFTIQMISNLPSNELAHWTAVILALPIILTGLSVSFVIAGKKGLRDSFSTILITGSTMAFTQWLMATHGMPQMAALMAGVAGMLMLAVILWIKGKKTDLQRVMEMPGASMGFWTAFSPYIFLVGVMTFLQIPAIKNAVKTLKVGWTYPAHVTRVGYSVPAEKMYGSISLITHPAPILLLAAVFGMIIYKWLGRSGSLQLNKCFAATVKQCTSTTITTALLLMMALTMNDSGMTTYLAEAVAALSGRSFPVFSDLIGALGCFLTGSNTSSNVLFGAIQVEAAKALGASPMVVAAAQTTGGSLGSAIAPAKVLLGAATLSLSNQEPAILRTALGYTTVILLITSIPVALFAFN